LRTATTRSRTKEAPAAFGSAHHPSFNLTGLSLDKCTSAAAHQTWSRVGGYCGVALVRGNGSELAKVHEVYRRARDEHSMIEE
jgi:hypothetical protein